MDKDIERVYELIGDDPYSVTEFEDQVEVNDLALKLSTRLKSSEARVAELEEIVRDIGGERLLRKPTLYSLKKR